MRLGFGLTMGQSSLGNAAPLTLSPLEAGLTLTAELPAYTQIDPTNVGRYDPAVMAATFTGLDGSAGGLIAEFGGNSLGAYCGFREDGTFVVRCGDTTYDPLTDTNPAAAHLVIAPGVVGGDGVLLVELTPGTPISLRAWWQDTPLLGVVEGASGNSAWSGSTDGGFLFSTGTYSQFAEVIDSNVAFQTVSALRYYRDQTVNV